ncbi:hypothetical protein BDQ17DRAFT_1371678 [Cyathus striatus]|nr:hypothetical protein BDQ17DRAFT_1371678 [Cyathus striatus]
MVFQRPLDGSTFRLDTSGVAGFFGTLGEEAIAAMSTVHIFEGRKWLGWYNSPGSFIVAKKYQQLASSRASGKSSDPTDIDPGTLFGQQKLLQECQNIKDSKVVQGRKTTPVARMEPQDKELVGATASPKRRTIILACIPIFSSLAACIASGVYQDWYCFAMILLGIISSGISCFTIGCADFVFRSLFGQIMFLSSVSVDTMNIQRQILVDKIIKIQSPGLQRYIFGTRTSMTPSAERYKVWRVWKDSVADMAQKGMFDNEKRNLGIHMYGDAQTAFDEYQYYLGRLGLV